MGGRYGFGEAGCIQVGVAVDRDGSFFALGEVREYPDGSAIKAIKTFLLD